MSTEGSDRQLHRYVDRDLPADERAALEREIASDDVLKRKIAALGDVSVLVRGAAGQEPLAEADSAAMWAKIAAGAGLKVEAGVEASRQAGEPSARPALRLVPSAPSGVSEASPASTKELAPAARTIVEDPAARRRRR